MQIDLEDVGFRVVIDTYRKILDLLDHRERRNFFFLLAMFVVAGLIEVVGVASIFPFLAVLSNPAAVQVDAYLGVAYDALGFTSTNSFLLFLGIVVLVILFLRIASEALTQSWIMYFSQMRNYSLSTRLFEAYLQRPYSWFMKRHTADLAKTVLSEVEHVVTGVILPAMRLLSQLFVVALVIGLVVVVHPIIALMAAAVIGSTYGLVYIGSRKYLFRIGTDRLRANKERFQCAQEAMGGIKEVKTMGMEAGYVERFRNPAGRFARHQVASFIIGIVPRYVMEAIVFGGMLLLVITLLALRGGSVSDILPTLGLYAFAGYRLLPALQKIFQAVTKLRFNRPALDILHRELAEKASNQPTLASASSESKVLSLRRCITLNDIRYTYPDAEHPALKGLTLIIPANSSVGLIGTTGAGKSTVVDLILGLLQAQQGEVCIDGVPLTMANLRAWQRSIGYVPQHIFLADDSIASNIAFGTSEEEVDMAAVERSAKIAELHAFVTTELPQGYHTLIGERGVRLSGGQRQRMGIARALYRDPQVLVFDEATSALDNLTERAVMDAIRNLGHRKTIILVAHRLTTVKQCDHIFMLDHGRLSASGTYEELLGKSHEFRLLADEKI